MGNVVRKVILFHTGVLATAAVFMLVPSSAVWQPVEWAIALVFWYPIAADWLGGSRQYWTWALASLAIGTVLNAVMVEAPAMTQALIVLAFVALAAILATRRRRALRSRAS